MTERVLILGGGCGGTLLANLLPRRRFEVTLVSDSDQHLFQPDLLYLAFQGRVANPVRAQRPLLRKHVRFVRQRVEQVDLDEHAVRGAGGEVWGYDQLVVATGIRTVPEEIPGLVDINDHFGDYHSSISQARKLWAKLDGFDGGTIVLGQSSPICKCPPSPVEGVLLTDALLRRRGLRNRSRLVFFTPYPRPYPAEPMNEIVEPILKERGIEVVTFFDLDRVDPATSTLHSIEGDEILYDLPIVVPPFAGSAIEFVPAGTLDQSRFVITDRHTLRIVGVEDAFAIGDATNLPTSKAGVEAHLEASLVARTLTGHPRPFTGRTNCPLDLADGRGTFVIGSYEVPVTRLRPTRLRHLMKKGFAHLYWLTLRGWLEPFFNIYFKMTEPKGRRV